MKCFHTAGLTVYSLGSAFTLLVWFDSVQFMKFFFNCWSGSVQFMKCFHTAGLAVYSLGSAFTLLVWFGSVQFRKCFHTAGLV